jgi:putative redox protein
MPSLLRRNLRVAVHRRKSLRHSPQNLSKSPSPKPPSLCQGDRFRFSRRGVNSRAAVLPVILYPLTCSLGGAMQTAAIQWIGDEKFVATSPSGHTITIDSDRASNKAPGPMELLLMALGGCTATDVVSILKKKRQKLASLEVICSGERAAEPPMVWTKLEVLYRLRGSLDEAAVKRAIELSEQKYCSVSAMLQKTASLSWRYEILAPAE